MSSNEPKNIPIKDIISEEGAHELASSDDMKPYLDLIIAEMQGQDTTPQMKALEELPLDKRYVWRVASALKWAFADFDNVNVEADTKTMKSEDLETQ